MSTSPSGRRQTRREQVARAVAEAADDGVFDRDEPDCTSDDEDRDFWLRLADAALAALGPQTWCPECFEAPEPDGPWAAPGDRCADEHVLPWLAARETAAASHVHGPDCAWATGQAGENECLDGCSYPSADASTGTLS